MGAHGTAITWPLKVPVADGVSLGKWYAPQATVAIIRSKRSTALISTPNVHHPPEVTSE
jgi:hypothetical protein